MKSNLYGFDLDGVILSYEEHAGGPVRINTPLIEKLAESGLKELCIITNQGGMAFSKMQTLKPYPTPARVAARIMLTVDALWRARIRTVGVYVSTYHPYFTGTDTCHTVAEELYDLLTPFQHTHIGELVISNAAESRKPSPNMLKWAGVCCFFGDSDTDREAAEAAGVPFVPVERFK